MVMLHLLNNFNFICAAALLLLFRNDLTCEISDFVGLLEIS